MQVLPMCLYLKMLVVKSALYPFKKNVPSGKNVLSRYGINYSYMYFSYSKSYIQCKDA